MFENLVTFWPSPLTIYMTFLTYAVIYVMEATEILFRRMLDDVPLLGVKFINRSSCSFYVSPFQAFQSIVLSSRLITAAKGKMKLFLCTPYRHMGGMKL
jgi:hypothetical protein